jgi:hypothetical protein
MNWETVSSALGHNVYALWNNGRKLLTLAFKPGSSFAKVEYGQEKRAFLLRYEGVFRNKMVMRNEYGIRLGQMNADGADNTISLNDEKLFYSIGDGKEPQLTIYKESIENPLAVCSFKLGNERTVSPEVRLSATAQSLMLALCWYLFTPVNQRVPEFA